jgi:multiple sugar transport system permease protein
MSVFARVEMLRRRSRQSEDANERTLFTAVARRRPLVRLVLIVMFGVLFLLSLTTLGPLYWMFTGALKTSNEIFQMPPTWWPLDPQWNNYPQAWSNLNYTLYFSNTIILTIGSVALQLFVSTTAAYALSKLKPVFGSVIFFLFLCTLMVPGIAYLIPQYLTVIDLPLLHLRLMDTWWAVWLPQSAHAFNIILLKGFFDDIPGDLVDAARIDGANAWQIFVRIMLPLAKPALAVVTIFTVVASWKDFLWPLLVLTRDEIQPLMVAIYRFSGLDSMQPLNTIIAGLALASIPPIILFLIFQRSIVRGISLTGLKG